MDRLEVLKQIIARGGIFGKCAEMYYNDVEMSNQFILECYDYCSLELLKDFWGETLIENIKRYYNDRKLTSL